MRKFLPKYVDFGLTSEGHGHNVRAQSVYKWNNPSSIPYGPQLGPGLAKLGPSWAPVGLNLGPFGNAAWEETELNSLGPNWNQNER